MAPAASDYVEEDLLSLVGISRDELRLFFSEQVRDQTVAFWYENAFDGSLCRYIWRPGPEQWRNAVPHEANDVAPTPSTPHL